VLGKIRKIQRVKTITVQLQLRPYKATALSMQLHSSGLWPQTTQMKKLEASHHKWQQRILKIKVNKIAAVYLEANCNIYSKRAFPTDILGRLHTTVYLFTDTTSHSCHTRIGLFTFASWLSKTPTLTVNDCRKFVYVRFLNGTYSPAERLKLILTIKMETTHPIEVPFDREFPAICSHCRVMTA